MLGSMHLPGSPYRLHCLFVEPKKMIFFISFLYFSSTPCTPTPAAEQHPQFVDRPPEELQKKKATKEKDTNEKATKEKDTKERSIRAPIRAAINERLS